MNFHGYVRRAAAVAFASMISVETAFSQSAGGQAAAGADSSSVGPPIGLLTGARLFPNWSDLPVDLSITQSSGYNDNIIGALGYASSSQTPKGDLFATTLVGGASKLNYENQQIIVKGSYGFTNYATNTAYDTSLYAITSALNWQADICSGQVNASTNQSQRPLEELLAPGIETYHAQSLTGTAKCRALGDFNVLSGAGYSSSQNSQAVSSANSYNSYYVKGGLEYSPSTTTTFGLTTTYTDRTFPNRAFNPAATGLANSAQQIDSALHIQRVISPSLSFNGSFGITQATAPSGQSGGSNTLTAPTYRVALTWQLAPKISFAGSSYSSVSAPASVLANAQSSRGQSVTVSYLLFPKITLSASGSLSSFGAVLGSSTYLAATLTNRQTLTLSFRGVYELTPFVAGTLSYQHSNTRYSGFETAANIITVGLSFQPR